MIANSHTIKVVDTNNEKLTGVSIELVGTGKKYYTDINGECKIPQNILEKSKNLIINFISYKVVNIEKGELEDKITLETR